MDELPSGDWTGYYEQGARTRQDLFLSFAGGRLTGAGSDPVGLFSVRGGTAGAEVWWTKRYRGGHDVFYRGRYDGAAVGGTWEIGDWSRGEFRIWPVGTAENLSQFSNATAEAQGLHL